MLAILSRNDVFLMTRRPPRSTRTYTLLRYTTLFRARFALDARTRRPCQDCETNGQVDTTIGMGEVSPGYVSINSPPTSVRGVVVTGHQVLDGQDRWAPSGVIRGFDAVTGKLRWEIGRAHV